MIKKVSTFLELIKFSHTIFALPFALISVVLAFNRDAEVLQDKSGWEIVFWVIIAMVGARSGAMGFNRLIDRKYDAENPRTANRPSVTGEISPTIMIVMIVIAFAILIGAAWQLNLLALKLSPLAIFLVCFYSYTKRVTSYAHLFLGFAIGCAPVASWIAVTGSVSRASLILGASVLTWIAGFDVLYALQDYEFDKKAELKSIPTRFGIRKSLMIAKLLHCITIALWLHLAVIESLNGIFYLGIGISAILLFWEHRLLKNDDLSKLGTAFFNMNSYISITLLTSVVLDTLIF